MKRSLSDRLGPVIFAVSLGALCVSYGVVAAWWGWFPAIMLGHANETLNNIRQNWKNDLELEPTRHLVAPAIASRSLDNGGFQMHIPGAAEPGYTLISGLNPDQDVSFHAVSLYDGTGQLVHRWPIHYEALDPKGRSPANVMLHGMEVFPDGSLAVTFDGGAVLARLDPCGKPIWALQHDYHHSISADGAGGLWAWRGEGIWRVDAVTGEETEVLDLRRDIIPAGGDVQRGLFFVRTAVPESDPGTRPLIDVDDPFHPNDVEALRPDMAAAFPMFRAGDLLVSFRELNLIGVLDPKTGLLKWSRQGPWLKQHDPDFEADGTISVYDNAPGTGVSAIRSVNPATNEVRTLFEGSPETPFYSWRRGKHQTLGNGDILVTEAEHGRVFEIDPAGRIVWERDMAWDKARNMIVTEARHVPADFFAAGVPSCSDDGPKQSAALVPDLRGG